MVMLGIPSESFKRFVIGKHLPGQGEIIFSVGIEETNCIMSETFVQECPKVESQRITPNYFLNYNFKSQSKIENIAFS